MLDFFCNKVAGVKAFKERLPNRCFPVNIAKILKTAFFIEPPVAGFVDLVFLSIALNK